MLKVSLCIAFILSLLYLPIAAAPTVADQALIKSFLIKKIIDNTAWPEGNMNEPLTVGVFAGDSVMNSMLINAFRINVKHNTRVAVVEKLSDAEYLHAIYVTGSHLDQLKSNMPFCIANHILVITDEVRDMSISMVDVRTVKNKLALEVNQEMLKTAGLQISSEVILAVGNKKDIANLFVETADSIRQFKEELRLNEIKLVKQQTLYREQQLRLAEIEQLLADKSDDITKLSVYIRTQKEYIAIMSKSLSKQQADYEAKLKSIRRLELKIDEYRRAIDIQKGKISLQDSLLLERQQKVSTYNAVLRTMQDSISAKNISITSQKVTISRQSYINTITISFAVLLSAVLALVVLSLHQKRKANKKLFVKNAYIHQQKEELRIAFDQLKDVQSQLVSSEKMASLGLLTAGIAHEINNSINYISASVSSLKMNLADIEQILQAYSSLDSSADATGQLVAIEHLKKRLDYDILMVETAEMFGIVIEGTDRAAAIVRSLRTFSRLDEDGLKQVDLHANIDNTLLLLSDRIKNRIKLERSYSADIALLDCYSGPMNQVYMNILSNAIDAIDASGRPGTIHIQTELHENTHIKMKFTDTGNGIDKDTIGRMFDPFFTTKDVGCGTGLGLSITRNIIQKHNGTVTVESTNGTGTSICIILPLNQA